MALLNRCLCFNLLVGSVLSGVYATAAYIVAFAMEIWLITEAPDELPTPTYILCVVYFITWTVSVSLLVGLALRRTKPMLAWLLCIIVLFFPESGLVLFMSFYHWSLESSFGKAEFIFWIIRGVINILSVLAIFSLYSQWKEEKNVNRRLRDLTMTSPMSNGYYNNNAVIKTPLPGSLRAGFHNAAYLSSQMNLQQCQKQQINKRQLQPMTPLNRMQSEASLNRSTSIVSLMDFEERKKRPNFAVSGLSRWQNTANSGFSRGGLAFSSMGVAGVGLNLQRQYVDATGRPSQHHSLLFTDQYLDETPLSRAVSTTLLNNPHSLQFSGPIFDRQSQFVVRDPTLNFKPAMRRAHSMNDLRFSDPFVSNWQFQPGQPFSYIIPMPNQQRSRLSIGAESDEIQRSYKDVAL